MTAISEENISRDFSKRIFSAQDFSKEISAQTTTIVSRSGLSMNQSLAYFLFREFEPYRKRGEN